MNNSETGANQREPQTEKEKPENRTIVPVEALDAFTFSRSPAPSADVALETGLAGLQGNLSGRIAGTSTVRRVSVAECDRLKETAQWNALLHETGPALDQVLLGIREGSEETVRATKGKGLVRLTAQLAKEEARRNVSFAREEEEYFVLLEQEVYSLSLVGSKSR